MWRKTTVYWHQVTNKGNCFWDKLGRKGDTLRIVQEISIWPNQYAQLILSSKLRRINFSWILRFKRIPYSRQPDIFFIKKRTCHQMDFAIPIDYWEIVKLSQKQGKCCWTWTWPWYQFSLECVEQSSRNCKRGTMN